MIRVVYGEDRDTILKKIKREFKEGYEVFEGENLKSEDLPSIFLGVSLFAEKREIVIKDLSEGGLLEEAIKYLDTPHEIVIWETKLDKRKADYKKLKKAGIEITEYKLVENVGKSEIFDVFEVGLRDGKRAVKMVERIENEQDPFMFVGLLAMQAIKKFEVRGGEKEKRVLEELSKLDIDMKSTALEPWMLVKLFLLKLSSL